MKQEELMKVMAEANSCDEICPVIDKIAELANGSFELLAETVFERDEDEIIFSLMMKFFAEEKFMEAVDILALSFSLAGAEEAFMFMALIACVSESQLIRMLIAGYMPPAKPDDRFHEDMNLLYKASEYLLKASKIASDEKLKSTLYDECLEVREFRKQLMKKYLSVSRETIKWQ